MNYHVVPSGHRKPASDEVLVRLIILPASRLEGRCQQASAVGIGGSDPCTYCSWNKPFTLCCGIGSENLMSSPGSRKPVESKFLPVFRDR